MSAILISIVTVIYLGVAVTEFVAGRPGISIAFLGYALANLGLIYNTL